MSTPQLFVGDILAVLLSRYDDEFHWAICVPYSSNVAAKFHGKQVGEGAWFFENPPPDESLLKTQNLAAAVKIGTIDGDVETSITNFTKLLATIPMEVPVVDADIERFNCRVWFREAVRKLAGEGIIQCSDIDALEKECRAYAETNDASQPTHTGYAYFVSQLSK